MDSFPAGVGEKLQYYVYRLIDPRNGETFYVGKGRGDRLFQHVRATRSEDVTVDVDLDADEMPDDNASLKVEIIRKIRQASLEVIHVIHRHGIEDARTAYEVEAALIDAYAGLSNLAAGHYSNARGPMHAKQIVDKYALPEFDPGDDKLVLININSYDHDTDEELLDRTRYAWRVAEYRVRKADYVIAAIHGIARGVFKPTRWLRATPDNFPAPWFAETDPQRMGFHGAKAPPDVWERYVGQRGKRVPENIRHKGQNPIRYHNC